MTIEPVPVEKIYPVPPRLLSNKGVPTPFVSSMDQYKKMWEESVNEPNKFFGDVSNYFSCFLPSQYSDSIFN